MNLDLSTAPEIAQLAGLGAPPEPFRSRKGGNRLTAGSLAAQVQETAADPARWWSRVRFDPERPVRTRLAVAPGWELWLVTTPPGHRSGQHEQNAGCEVVTVLAGELAECTDGGQMLPLRPNRVRVRGNRRRRETVNPGDCYAVSLHAWS
jgi:Cysteine dioxygenase type I